MNIQPTIPVQTSALVPRGQPVRPAESDTFRASPPVERVVEGELLGRDYGAAGTASEQFGRRMRLQGVADHGPQDSFRNHDALAVYLGVASVATGRSATLDLYA